MFFSSNLKFGWCLVQFYVSAAKITFNTPLYFLLQAKPSWRSRHSRSRLLLSSRAACGWALAAVPFSPSHCPSVSVHFDWLHTLFSQKTLSSLNCTVVHSQHQKPSQSHTVLLPQHSFATMDTDKLSGSSLLHLVRFGSFQLALWRQLIIDALI